MQVAYPYVQARNNLLLLGLDSDQLVNVNKHTAEYLLHDRVDFRLDLPFHPNVTPNNGAALLVVRLQDEIRRHANPHLIPREIAQSLRIAYTTNNGSWASRFITLNRFTVPPTTLKRWRRLTPMHLLHTMGMCVQSAEDIDINNIELLATIHYDNTNPVFGNGLCGYIALACGIDRIKNGAQSELCCKRTGERKERQDRLRESRAKDLQEQLDIRGPLQMPSDLVKFLEHPSFDDYRILYTVHRSGEKPSFLPGQLLCGARWVGATNEKGFRKPGKTICLRYWPDTDPAHVEEISFEQFTKEKAAALDYRKNRNTYDCPHCLEVVQDGYGPKGWRFHSCPNKSPCSVCNMPFTSEDLDEHYATPLTDQVECLGCNQLCYGTGCLTMHTRWCNQAPSYCTTCKTQHYLDESCDWPKCPDCNGKKRRVKPNDLTEHRHYISKPRHNTKGKDVVNWVYDLETLYYYQQDGKQLTAKQAEIERNSTIPKGAVKVFVPWSIRAQPLDSDDPADGVYFEGFDCLSKFRHFVFGGGKIKVFWAHNGGRFDTRFIMDWFIKDGMQLSTIQDKSILMGNKVVDLVLGKPVVAKFRDFYLHASAPLAALPGMYGISGVKKGHFPHDFSYVDNVEYEGPMPDFEWFDPGGLKAYCTPFTKLDKKKEYEHNMLAWWEEEHRKFVPYTDQLWNFKEQMRLYLEDDVRVLRAAMTEHRKLMKEAAGIDPMLHATQAKVAMESWRTSHMPTEKCVEIPRMIVGGENHTKWANMQKQLEGCYQGGNVNLRKVFHRVGPRQRARGVHIAGVDKVSLYPSVMYNRQYPCGDLQHYDFDEFTQPTLEWLKEQVGAIKCRLWWPDTKPPPLFPRDRYAIDGKLCHSLSETAETAISRPRTLIKFLACVEQGYEWDQVEWVVAASDVRKDLFNSYITGMYRIKTKCGGMPDSLSNKPSVDDMLKWAMEEYEASGVDIMEEWSKDRSEPDPDKAEFGAWFPAWFEKNPGLKGVAKLMLNSLYGKFGEKRVKTSNKFVDSDLEVQQIAETDPMYQGMFQMGSGFVVQTYGKTTNGIMSVNVLIAAHVTDYGMLELNYKLEEMGEDVLYHDTDSVFMVWDPAKHGGREHPPTGDHLGQWSDDVGTTTTPWKRPDMFVAISPKSYAIAQTFDLSEEAYQRYLADPNLSWFAERHAGKPWEQFYAECEQVPDAIFENEDGSEVFVEVLKIRMKGITMNSRNARLLTFRHMMGMSMAMCGREDEIDEGEGSPLEVHYQSWRWNRPAMEFTVQDTRKVVKGSRQQLKGKLTKGGKLLPFGAERFECWKHLEFVN